MSTTAQQHLVEQIHSAGRQLVLSITGGGSGAIAALLEVPGASASVLEAVVPYAAAALEEWLGGPVDQHCSERTARAMAMASFERARHLTDVDPHMLRGIGATASLATNRPKRGAHRIHVAWQSAETTAVASCELVKGKRTRAEEEQIAKQLILGTVAEACGIESPPPLDPVLQASAQRRRQDAPAAWTELLLGQRTSVVTGEQRSAAPSQIAVLFPGAFNPLHAGHEQMAALATKRCGKPVRFELSIGNVDKPPLDFVEIADRVEQFGGRRLMLTRAATFVEKSRLAPGCIFVVGADTLERIADPRYYGGDLGKRDAAIAEIANNGCHFLVFGRLRGQDFATVSGIDVPAELHKLCESIPESEFRADISSTELRADE